MLGHILGRRRAPQLRPLRSGLLQVHRAWNDEDRGPPLPAGVRRLCRRLRAHLHPQPRPDGGAFLADAQCSNTSALPGAFVAVSGCNVFRRGHGRRLLPLPRAKSVGACMPRMWLIMCGPVRPTAAAALPPCLQAEGCTYKHAQAGWDWPAQVRHGRRLHYSLRRDCCAHSSPDLARSDHLRLFARPARFSA